MGDLVSYDTILTIKFFIINKKPSLLIKRAKIDFFGSEIFIDKSYLKIKYSYFLFGLENSAVLS